MGRKIPVVLGNRRFEKKSDAHAHFKGMLKKYNPGDRVSEDDCVDLGELLKKHREYSEKAGAGVSHFEVMRADYYSKCFKVIRIDGTETDFSYTYCIDGY